MKSFLLAAAAAIAIASPAAAQDSGGYAGIEAGVLFPQSSKIDIRTDDTTIKNVFKLDYDTGYDVDVVGGYDFGSFRLEGEVAYKHAGLDELHELINPDEFEVGGHATVWSAMINGLADFNVGGAGLYAGAGLGRGWVSFSGDDVGGGDDSDSAWAYQLIAGAYVPVSHNIDVGLKYRYFATQRLTFGIEPGEALRSHFRSHSLLASLVFHFGSVAAPPPPVAAPIVETAPPPPPPATQVCADGTTILATDMCPAAPTPPPPPPPAPERG